MEYILSPTCYDCPLAVSLGVMNQFGMDAIMCDSAVGYCIYRGKLQEDLQAAARAFIPEERVHMHEKQK